MVGAIRVVQRKLQEAHLRTAEVLQLSLFQVSILFILLSSLQALGLFLFPISLGLFAIVLPVLFVASKAFDRSDRAGHWDWAQEPRWVGAALLLLVGMALILRVGPYLRAQVPLGYDVGLYRYLFNVYIEALPSIPEWGLEPWFRGNYPQGLPLWATVAHELSGLSTDALLVWVFPVLSAGLVLAVYVYARGFLRWQGALLAAGLYAVSSSQYMVFGLMYYKNVIALWLLLLVLYSLQRRWTGPFVVLLAGVAIFHRPTFLLLSVALVPLAALLRRPRVLLAALVAGALVAPFWLVRWDSYFWVADNLQRALTVNLLESEGIEGGNFLTLAEYREASLVYLAFAFIGLILFVRRQEWTLLIPLGVAAIISVFELFFFRRYLIYVDIFVIVLAAAGAQEVFLRSAGSWRSLGAAACGLLVLAVTVPTWQQAQAVQPHITQQQLDAVRWLERNTEVNAKVLTTGYDAPWVMGWSQRPVVTGGLFQWNQHNREQWARFNSAGAYEEVEEFLQAYGDPLYVFVTKGYSATLMSMSKFRDRGFRVVYEDDSAVIFRHVPLSS